MAAKNLRHRILAAGYSIGTVGLGLNCASRLMEKAPYGLNVVCITAMALGVVLIQIGHFMAHEKQVNPPGPPSATAPDSN